MTELYTTKESKRYPGLSIRKYTRKVFYDNLWHRDPLLVESRGHVVNSQGKLVVNPLTKVFNRNENGTDLPLDTPVLAIDKINGFMACLTYVAEVNDVVVSTTGSLDSDYVDMARSMLPYAIEQVRQRAEPITYVFEIVHPDDPHIIPENVGAYLLAARLISDTYRYHSTPYQEIGLDQLAIDFRVARPEHTVRPFNQVLDLAKSCKHEGYMVYPIRSGLSPLKLKSPYYLTLKAMARSKDILSLSRSRVDEEYYPLLDHLTSLGDSFNSLPEQSRLDYIRDWIYDNS